MKKLLTDKSFILSFSISLILIFFIASLVTVDLNGRKTLFNDHRPIVYLLEETLYLNLFGLNFELSLNIFYRIFEALGDFVCIPLKIMVK